MGHARTKISGIGGCRWVALMMGCLAFGCGTERDGSGQRSADTPTAGGWTGPSGDTGGMPTEEPSGPSWTPLATGGLTGTWGSFPAGRHHVGGLSGLGMGTGATSVVTYAVEDGTLVATDRGQADVPRYCGCGFEDTTRGELVVVGGRNDGFTEEPTVERIDADGLTSSLEHAGAADSPVGCAAFYVPETDRGYVFGGAGGGRLSDQLWRYDPVDSTFTAVDVPGPSARYDAGVVQLDDGRVFLVGGLTDDGMASDVWSFDPLAEAWTEWAPASAEVPEGRRFPFLVSDGEALYYGYGTSSPTGQRMLKQVWRFELASRAWTQLTFEGDTPDKRGFAVSLPGPPGSLGVLAFGFDGDRTVYEDAWVLWP